MAIALALLTTACGDSGSPSAPSPAATTPIGTWIGALSDPLTGEGTARVTFAEAPPSTTQFPTAPGSIAGPWSVTFRNGDTVSGRAVGIPFASSYAVTLYPDEAPCLSGQGPGTGLMQYTLTNVSITSRTFTAALVRSSCVDNRFGTVSLTRQ